MNSGFSLFPPGASVTAHRTDLLYFALVGLSSLASIILLGLIVWFSVRYRRGSSADRRNPPTGDNALEAAWTLTPLLVFLGLFVWAAYDFVRLYRPPDDTLPIFVVARQWMWKVEHPNGRREIDELHIPVGQPVRLLMTSQDAIHSFYVPAFRLKQDVVPGRYSALWFEATEEGEYHLFCAEYCGTDHARMTGSVHVMAPEDYAAWLDRGNAEIGISERGFALFRQHGCAGCHSVNSSVHAPDLTALLGRTVPLQGGGSLIADETYVYDSIMEPDKQVVAGYDSIMPSFKGQLDEDDIMAIIEYIRVMPGDEPVQRVRP